MHSMCFLFSQCWLFVGISSAQTSVFVIYVIQNQICITKSQQHCPTGIYDTKSNIFKIIFPFAKEALCILHGTRGQEVRHLPGGSSDLIHRYFCPLGRKRKHINQVTHNSINFLETSHNFLFPWYSV